MQYKRARTHKGYSIQKLKFSIEYPLCLAREVSLDPLSTFLFKNYGHQRWTYFLNKKAEPKKQNPPEIDELL